VVDKNEITLSSGKSVYACRGIVGIGPDGATYTGFDGYLGEHCGSLTMAETVEICKMMEKRWKDLREAHTTTTEPPLKSNH
jgi:hypothetical protein